MSARRRTGLIRARVSAAKSPGYPRPTALRTPARSVTATPQEIPVLPLHMRTFFLFVALLAVSLVLAAVLTYPAWLLVGTISVEPVHRVMNRLAMLIALIGLVVLTRRLGLANRAAMGYGLPRGEFMRQLAIGWLGGVMLMAPLVALLLGLEVRTLKEGFVQMLPASIAGGFVSGLAVALIEETFFRGVLFTALSPGSNIGAPPGDRDAVARSSGILAAVLAPSLLYACLHFLGGRLRIPNDEVSWLHGFTVLGRLFERYADPLVFVDSFLALTMLGILLALVRWRTGAIAACIGLHAAGVCVIAVLRTSTTLEETRFSAIVGSYDGVIGWAALAWFGAIAFTVALTPPRVAGSWRVPAGQ